MKRSIVSTALALALALGAVLPASATEQRPFSGKFTGSGIAADQRCGPGALTIGHQVSGVATHLGRFTGTGTNCTEFTFATETVAIWDGIVTIRAADGSTLTLTAEGSQSAPVAGVASYTHTDTVVSGTIDFSTFAVTGSVYGWLSY